MPSYACESRDSSGNLVKSSVDAPSENEALHLLSREGLFPVHVTEIAQQQGTGRMQTLRPVGGARAKDKGKRIKLKVLLDFSRQLGSSLHAGVPILAALQSMTKQFGGSSFQAVLARLAKAIEGGQPLSAAMHDEPRAFPPVYASTIEAGEKSGSLDDMLENLATYLEGEIEVRASVRSALLYPTIVVGTLTIAVSVLVVFVIPRFAEVYSGLSADLPFITRAMIGVSTWVSNYALFALALSIGAAFGLKRAVQTPTGKAVLDRTLLKVPIAGHLIDTASTLRIAEMLGLFTSAGVPVLQGLESIAGATGNTVYRERLEITAGHVASGESLGASLELAGCFRPANRQMLVSGESSGSLEKSCKVVANALRKELGYLTKNLATMIEPLMTLVLAVVVLFVALAVFLPMWNLAGAVQG